MRTILFIVLSLALNRILLAQNQPIIDMHRHAPLSTETSDNETPAEVIKTLIKHNVVISILSITSSEQAQKWGARSDRFILGAMMPCPRNLGSPWYYCFPKNKGLPDLEWLRENVQSGVIGAFHEMMFNYDGSMPGDRRMAPYWALAAELSIPVGVHSWSGPPPGRSIRRDPNCCPNYNGDIGNPKHLRPVLERHPGLKIWLQHVGSDGNAIPELWAETLSLLRDYPSVYVDLSITNSVLPMKNYEDALLLLINSGFADRIMFGSDNVHIDVILKRLNSVKNISTKQRRAILFDNAARFLGLSETEQQKHYQH